MTFREKVEPVLDKIEVGFVIGLSQDGGVVFVPHTHGAVSKLGLVEFARLIIEQDAKNQIYWKEEMLQKARLREMGMLPNTNNKKEIDSLDNA